VEPTKWNLRQHASVTEQDSSGQLVVGLGPWCDLPGLVVIYLGVIYLALGGLSWGLSKTAQGNYKGRGGLIWGLSKTAQSSGLGVDFGAD
jgi:hypothetical protein